jgi:hypothetical protein
MVWSSGGNCASPEAGLSLETNSVSPKPSLVYMSPVNPAGGHSFNCNLHNYQPRSGLAMALGRLSPCPSMASASMLPTRECPTSPEAAELTYYQELFAILTTAPTTTTWTASPSDRLGYVTEPSALASALCVLKDANIGTGHPPADTSQQQVQGPYERPYPKALLETINRDI